MFTFHDRAAFSAILTILVCGALTASEPSLERVRTAVEKSLPLLQKGAAGHAAERTCFACHNQGVPLIALDAARSRGLKIDEDEVARQGKAIAAFLDKNRTNYLKGKGTGGQVDTAGYGLWALERTGRKPDEITAAVTEYLLLRDEDKDHWTLTARRPPSEMSPFTTNYLGLRGLRTFGTSEQKERIERRVRQVREWIEKTPAKDTEDRVFRLWALKWADAPPGSIATAAEELLKSQHESGGWAQLDTLKPDAYATGSALVALHDAAELSADAPAYRRGASFLLDSQLEDGSWHVASRSKPFQTYYESGFPHGKDQFISIAASAWATAALTYRLPVKNR